MTAYMGKKNVDPKMVQLMVAPKRPSSAARRGVLSDLSSTLLMPMRFSQYYLWGTVCIFLVGNLVQDVSNLPLLLIFLVLAYGGFYLGYRIALGPLHKYQQPAKISDFGATQSHQLLIIAGALYFAAWGINQFIEFGGSGIGDIVRGILSPGASYSAKFAIFEERELSGYVSPVVRILLLLSVLYAIFLPLAVASWVNISRPFRYLVIVSTIIYVASFLFIGTMKGIGDALLLSLAGAAALVGKRKLVGRALQLRRRTQQAMILLALLMFAYMAVNQVMRAEEFGITESRIVGDVSNTFIARTFGSEAAFGIYSVLAYPSHGYLGLSHSMSIPFEFSHGAGFSQAYESYRGQYFGGPDYRYLTYPERSEQITGWPAGLVWSTAFPWLASDLTFYLIPFFMVIMGAIFARVWVNVLYGTNALALATFSQMLIFIAFLPANNQVLMQRQGFIVVISLIGLGIFHFLNKRRPV